MSKTITAIRHAQSTHNAGLHKTDKDAANCGLSDEGKKQAAKIELTTELLILSPLRRAMDTYIRSQIKTKEIVISPLFIEYQDGKPLNYLEAQPNIRETPNELVRRAQTAISYLKSLPQKNICIVSHGDFLNAFFKELGLKVPYPQNAQAFQFEV